MNPREPLPFLGADSAAILGVSPRTLRRWRQTGSLPAAQAERLRLLDNGDLGTLHADWTGWKLHRGRLYTPAGWQIERWELENLPIAYQQIAALDAERAGLVARVRHIERLAGRDRFGMLAAAPIGGLRHTETLQQMQEHPE